MPFPSNAFGSPGQQGQGSFYVNRSRRRQEPAPLQNVQQMATEATGEAPPPQDFDGTPTMKQPEVGFGYSPKGGNDSWFARNLSPETMAIQLIASAMGAGAFGGFGGGAGKASSSAAQRSAGHFAGLSPQATANTFGPTPGAVSAGAQRGLSGFNTGMGVTDYLSGGQDDGGYNEFSPDMPLTSSGTRGRLGDSTSRFNVAFNPFQEENAQPYYETMFGFNDLEGVHGMGQDQERPLGLSFNIPGYGSSGGSLSTGGGDNRNKLTLYGSKDKLTGSPTGQNDAMGITAILKRAMQSLYSIDPGTRGLGSAGGGLADRITAGPSSLEDLFHGMGSYLRGETSYTPNQSYGNEIR